MHNFAYYAERLQCSHVDKLHCLETAKKLYALSELAKEEGLLELEDAVEQEPDLFLKTAVDSMLDLAEEELVAPCLYAYLAAGDYHGKEFLNNMLIVEGLLLILRLSSPTLVSRSLKGWFGVEFAQTYHREMGAEDKRLYPKLPTPQSVLSAFDNLAFLTDAQAEQLLSAVDAKDLAVALKGAGTPVSNFLLGQLPEQERGILQSAISAIYNIRMKDVETAQQRILLKAKEQAEEC